MGMPSRRLRAPRAGRRRRRDHAVELPAPAQPRQDRARAGRRQHGRAEAGPRHAVVRRALGRLVAEETDIPPGVVNVVNLVRPRRRAQARTDPRVDLVSFTGSTATGRRGDGRSDADRRRRCSSSSAASPPSIVLDDADLARAAGDGAFAACIHAGQGCAITTRLLAAPGALRRGASSRRGDDAALGRRRPERTRHDVRPADLGPPARAGRGLPAPRPRTRAAPFAIGGGRPADPSGLLRRADARRRASTTTPGWRGRRSSDRCWSPSPTTATTTPSASPTTRPTACPGAVYGGDLDRAWAVARRIRTGTISVNGGVWYGGDVALRRLQAVRHRPRDGRRRLRGVPRDQGRRRSRRRAMRTQTVRRGRSPSSPARPGASARPTPRALAAEGAAVVVADLDDDAARTSPPRSRRTAGRIVVRVDVSSDPTSAEAMADGDGRALGGIDLLVNNAAIYGGMQLDLLLTVDWDYYRRFMAVNMDGALVCTRACCRHMPRAAAAPSSTSRRPRRGSTPASTAWPRSASTA